MLFGNLNIGQTYYLKIFSADCVECYTSFDLCLKEGGPPNDVPNLNFEYNVNNGSPISGTTVNASYDATYGLPVCVPPGTPIQDVWYFLENYDHINGEVTISNAGNEIKAALYKGNINTPANLKIIPSTCGSGSRTITLNGLEQGQFYWLRVWSENGNTGSFEVSYLDLTATTATVAAPAPNICSPTTSVTVDGSNANNVGIPVMMGDDLVLIIYPNGNDLGQVTVHFYVSSTPRTDDQNIPYLKRNMAIIPQFQPTPGNPVTLRFLMTTAEFNAFAVSLPDFKVTRVNDQPCAGAVAGSGNTLLSQPYAWANGSLLDGYYFDVQTDHFSSFYAHSGNIALQGAALPVELIDFQGKIQGSNAVLLTWRTGSEQDNLGFFVEKSTDGKWFEAIGFVPGAGTSLEEHAYSFFDENFRASAYYRLQQLDLDRREVFSPVVFLEKETEPDLRFFPNPAGSNVTFLFHEPSVKTTLVFYDWKGSIVYENAFLAGQTSLVLDVKNWKSGIYVVKLTLESKTIIKRLVVSR